MPNKSISAWMLAPVLLQMIPLVASAATIKVPLQQPTIQAAINAAVAGDTVQVSPGTYTENINFNGKAITVMAVRGARPTIIDGGSKASVVTFNSGEGTASVLSGFVIQHGFGGSANSNACLYDGGGICISNASPTIEYNTIKNNSACEGAGMSISFGSPLVQGNLIQNNTQGGCSGGTGGGGIEVGGAASARILNNIIENNSMGSADGGGISLFAAGTPTITGNIIRGNTASGISPCTNGGGIALANQSDATIVQNQITGNTATCGGGVFWLVPSGDRGPYVVNNTISDNLGSAGIYADGFDANSKVINNIVVGGTGQNALYCDGTYSVNPPIIQFDDFYAQGGSAYGGTCTDQTGKSGNISADPLFVSAANQNYHILIGSPAIDAGSNAAPSRPATDFDGAARVQDGNLDGTAKVDMGLDEFTPAPGTAPAAFATSDNADHRTSRVSNSQSLSAGRFYSMGSDSRRTTYAYDATGKLISQTDANGVKHSLK